MAVARPTAAVAPTRVQFSMDLTVSLKQTRTKLFEREVGFYCFECRFGCKCRLPLGVTLPTMSTIEGARKSKLVVSK